MRQFAAIFVIDNKITLATIFKLNLKYKLWEKKKFLDEIRIKQIRIKQIRIKQIRFICVDVLFSDLWIPCWLWR